MTDYRNYIRLLAESVSGARIQKDAEIWVNFREWQRKAETVKIGAALDRVRPKYFRKDGSLAGYDMVDLSS